MRRFEREVELAASLHHPNIVTIHDSGITSGNYYFVMDLVEGERLDVHLSGRDLPLMPQQMGEIVNPLRSGSSKKL